MIIEWIKKAVKQDNGGKMVKIEKLRIVRD